MRIITPFIFFKYADFLNIQNVCLQIYRNNRIREKVAYFLRKIQTLQANNSRILKIQNAKFSGYYVYMNTNIWRDFQICISAPVRQRQKLFLNLCFTLFKKCRVERRRRKRRCRRFEQNIGRFQKVWNALDDERFKACFRTSRETFEFNLNHIEHYFEHETTAEKPIEPKERLGICLHRLIRGGYYHTIAEMTSHGLSTIQNITKEVCSVIVSNLSHKFVISPESEGQMLRAIFKMESMWQFSGAFGKIAGCHIPIKCPYGGNEARK